jgi:hypothetical protein
MPADDFDVSRADDGRILVMTDTYCASFVNGTWHKKLLFKPEEIREDFMTVENAAEARRIRDEAVKALKL